MPLIDRRDAALLLIDFQSRLMPAIYNGAAVVANARRLVQPRESLQSRFCLRRKMSKGSVYIGGTGTGRIARRTQDDIRRVPLTGFPKTTSRNVVTSWWQDVRRMFASCRQC